MLASLCQLCFMVNNSANYRDQVPRTSTMPPSSTMPPCHPPPCHPHPSSTLPLSTLPPSANYRDQCFEARQLVEDDRLGKIHHVMCYMYR